MSSIYGSQQPNNKRARSPSPQDPRNPEQILEETIQQQNDLNLKEQRRADKIASNKRRREAADLEYETNINTIIDQINEQALFGFQYVDLDHNDPETRYVIGMVVRTHGIGEDYLRLLLRSPVLLRILQDRIRDSRIGRVFCAAGSTAAECARLSKQYLSSGLSRVASAALSRFGSPVRSRRARSPSPPRELEYAPEPYPNQAPEQPAPRQLAPVQLAPRQSAPRHLRGRRHSDLVMQLEPRQSAAAIQSTAAAVSRQYAADALLAQHLSGNADLEREALLAFKRPRNAPPAPASAAPPIPPPPLLREQDLECAICMTAANFIDERGVSYGPLGYIERHRNGAPGHPDRFHQSCLQGCHDRCPMCRADGPVWGMQRPPGQGGGGSRKTRSKSKSKTRRLRKSRSKPRKSRKSRKPRSSSRRK